MENGLSSDEEFYFASMPMKADFSKFRQYFSDEEFQLFEKFAFASVQYCTPHGSCKSEALREFIWALQYLLKEEKTDDFCHYLAQATFSMNKENKRFKIHDLLMKLVSALNLKEKFEEKMDFITLRETDYPKFVEKYCKDLSSQVKEPNSDGVENKVEAVPKEKEISYTNKPVEKMNLDELKENIEFEKKRLKDYEIQDESNFSDFEKAVKGKEVNIPLIRNHIAYYEKEIEIRNKNSLSVFINKDAVENKNMSNENSMSTEKQLSYCQKLCFEIGLAEEYAEKRIKNLTRKECCILIGKLLKGISMNEVFDYFEKTGAETLVKCKE